MTWYWHHARKRKLGHDWRAFCSVELSRIGRYSARSDSLLQPDSTQLKMFRNVQNLVKLVNQLSWVESGRRSDHSARSDATQPVELIWGESDRALWSRLKSPAGRPVTDRLGSASASTLVSSMVLSVCLEFVLVRWSMRNAISNRYVL